MLCQQTIKFIFQVRLLSKKYQFLNSFNQLAPFYVLFQDPSGTRDSAQKLNETNYSITRKFLFDCQILPFKMVCISDIHYIHQENVYKYFITQKEGNNIDTCVPILQSLSQAMLDNL